MKTPLILASLLAVLPLHSETPPPAALPPMASEVMAATGYANWPKVQRLEFTFRVVVDGTEKVAAKHDWNIAANTDIVTWAGKTVTVDLMNPGTTGDEKAAFQRWTNDSYWLIAPLKMKDPGTTLTAPSATTLELSFKGVGLTPGDRYLYEIDPATKLPSGWTYMPKPEAKNFATWEKYVTSGGLTLSTYHKMGPAEIIIDDLKVTTAP